MHFSELAISSNAFLTSVRGMLSVADGSARAELYKHIIADLLLKNPESLFYLVVTLWRP